MVRLNDTVAGGTKIVNSVTITSDNNNLSTTDTAAIAVTSFLPAEAAKDAFRRLGGTPGQPGTALCGRRLEITYAITFSNPATNRDDDAGRCSSIRCLVKSLSSAPTTPIPGPMIRARTFAPPTYTWRYASLAPGAQKTLHLVAQVGSKLDPNTVVSNSVTISSVQTAATQAGLDVLVHAVSVTPLYLQKTLARGPYGQPDSRGRPRVDPGSNITYTLTFSNPATNPTVTQVTVADTLPPELTFVSADGGNLGSYNAATQTYTWRPIRWCRACRSP